jgi:leucyl aminopeptidase (aminopeptidase T)
MIDDIKKSAMTAVRDCMGVKAGETVLVVSDTEINFIGKPVYESALELGAEAIYMEMKPRTISGEEPPKIIAEAMLNADVVIVPTKYSISHTEARKRASEKGARIATIPLTEDDKDLIKEMFGTGGMTADYRSMEQRIRKLHAWLNGTSRAHITTPLGTDLHVEFGGREWHMDTGLGLNKGDFTNLPGGELYIAPTNANGKLVIDGTFGDFGLLASTLTLEIRDGLVVGAKGAHADDLEELFRQLGPEARTVAEFGIGMNPKARLWGILLEDEKVGRTIHIAVGNNAGFGGTCCVAMHYDGIVTNPTVTIDDKKLNINEYL